MKKSTLRGKAIYGMSLLLAGLLLFSGCGEKADVYGEAQQGSRETEDISGATESAEESEEADDLVSAGESEASGMSESTEATEKSEVSESTEAAEKSGVSESTEAAEKSGESENAGAAEAAGASEDVGAAEESEASENAEKQENTVDTETPEAAANTAVPTLAPSIWQDNRYAEDGTLLVEGYFQSVEVSGEGFEAVAESVRDWFRQQEKSFEETVDLYEKYALDAAKDTTYFSAYNSYVESSSTRTDSSVISLKGFYRDYSGGAHGNYGSVGTTFDVQSGKQLSFWDLTEDRETFSQQTLEYCLQQVAEEYSDGLFDDYADTIQAVWQEEPNWYLDAAGITVIFNPYEIGPYAMGEAYVTLPYQEFAELLLPEYQMGERAGVSVLPEGASAELILGREAGEKTTVRIYEEPQEDGEYDYGFRNCLLDVGAQTEVAAEFNWLKNVYVLRREDGRTFLLFDGDMASDDYMTYVYELTDGQIRMVYKSQVCTEIREGTVTLQGLQLGIRVDALGTYTAYGDFQLGENGVPQQEGEWYTIDNPYAGGVLTNIRELPVVVDGKESMLPAGSKLRIIGTDMRGIMKYQLVDSVEEGEIHFEWGTDGWPIYIDGVSEFEYFENLPYAG